MEIIHINNNIFFLKNPKTFIIKRGSFSKHYSPEKNLIRELSCMRKGLYFVVVFKS